MEISILIIDAIVEPQTEMRRCGGLKELRLLIPAQFDLPHIRQWYLLIAHNLFQIRSVISDNVAIVC